MIGGPDDQLVVDIPDVQESSSIPPQGEQIEPSRQDVEFPARGSARVRTPLEVEQPTQEAEFPARRSARVRTQRKMFVAKMHGKTYE